jgi:hypothetical protein
MQKPQFSGCHQHSHSNCAPAQQRWTREPEIQTLTVMLTLAASEITLKVCWGFGREHDGWGAEQSVAVCSHFFPVRGTF